jgi:hypothetical protein
LESFFSNASNQRGEDDEIHEILDVVVDYR